MRYEYKGQTVEVEEMDNVQYTNSYSSNRIQLQPGTRATPGYLIRFPDQGVTWFDKTYFESKARRLS